MSEWFDLRVLLAPSRHVGRWRVASSDHIDRSVERVCMHACNGETISDDSEQSVQFAARVVERSCGSSRTVMTLCHLLAARIWQGSIEHCRAWAIRAVPVAPRFYTCTDAGFIVRTHGSLCTGLGYPPSWIVTSLGFPLLAGGRLW